MLYLSRLLLNPRERQVQVELARPYQMHRTLLQAFQEPLPVEERILFRVDWLQNQTLPLLLVQSHTAPKWERLPNPRYLLDNHDLPWGFEHPAEVKTWQPIFNIGQPLRFRLLANPTIKRAGKRYPIIRELDQIAWLQRKLLAAGARMVDVECHEFGRYVDTKREGPERHSITLYGVRFDGLLQVEDPQKLLDAVTNGIGSAKGLGFGLLSLASV